MIHHILLLGSAIDITSLPDAKDSFITTALSIVIRVTAAVCLLFITIGGFRYILAEGDPQGVSKAKSTIMYALIGLLVVIIAQAIVIFVVKGLS